VIIDPEKVRKALEQHTKAKIERFLCTCGCGCGVQYARDYRALWIASEITESPTFNVVEIRELVGLEWFIAGKSPAIQAVLRAAFAKGAS